MATKVRPSPSLLLLLELKQPARTPRHPRVSHFSVRTRLVIGVFLPLTAPCCAEVPAIPRRCISIRLPRAGVLREGSAQAVGEACSSLIGSFRPSLLFIHRHRRGFPAAGTCPIAKLSRGFPSASLTIASSNRFPSELFAGRPRRCTSPLRTSSSCERVARAGAGSPRRLRSHRRRCRSPRSGTRSPVAA